MREYRSFHFNLHSKLIVIIAVLIIFIQATLLHIIITENVGASSTWSQETYLDYNSGIFFNSTVIGTNKDAELVLESGNWQNMKLPIQPRQSFRHEMAQIYGTDKILMAGGEFQPNGPFLYNYTTTTWNESYQLIRPTWRFNPALAPIHGTDKVLFFGGFDYSTCFNETWIFDLSEDKLTQVYPTISPTGRYDCAVSSVYGTDKVLLFGGAYKQGKFNDTWIYDLSDNNWKQKFPANSPSNRSNARMACIYNTKDLVLFGGNYWTKPKTYYYNDTWLYNYTKNTWTQKSPVNSPNIGWGYSLTSVHNTDKLVYYGGIDIVNETYSKIWIYDHSTNTWTKKTQPSSPSDIVGHAAANVFGTDKIVFFGGREALVNNRFNETWIYDLSANNWLKKEPKNSPYNSKNHRISGVYDSGNVVLFGGYYNVNFLYSGTWVYNYTRSLWIKQTTITEPEPRYGHNMVPIYGTDKVLLFGGEDDNNNKLNDTWVYDLSASKWTKLNPINSLNNRTVCAMASIYGHDKVLLFGGYANNWVFDTWIFDLSDNNWTKKTTSTTPPGVHYDMTSIYGKDKVIMVGENNQKFETWIYDLSANSWNLKNPKNDPGRYKHYEITTLAGTDKVLLFCGDMPKKINETWIYDLSNNDWTQLNPSIQPFYRDYYRLATIYKSGEVLLYGGVAANNDDNLRDTWIFNLNGSYRYNGFYESKKFNTGKDSAFKTISWNGVNTINTSFKFQLRTAKSSKDLSKKNFVGVDGTTNTFYTSSSTAIWSGHYGDVWFQYKIYLNTNNKHETPRVHNVTIQYNKLPTSSLIYPKNGDFLNNNKPTFVWDFTDNDSAQQSAFQLLIGYDVDFNNIKFDSGQQTSNFNQWIFPLGTCFSKIPDGTWYWKVRTKDNDGDWGLYSKVNLFKIDTTQPDSMITNLNNDTFYRNPNKIRGEASDPDNGTGIDYISLSIQRLDNDFYWSGSNWTVDEKWYFTSGETQWEYDSSKVIWPSGEMIKLCSQGHDLANNTESPGHQVFIKIDHDKPVSTIDFPVHNSFLNRLNSISGVSNDYYGSGVQSVELYIKRESDKTFWNGVYWDPFDYWLVLEGKDTWIFDTSKVPWTTDTYYTISIRAIDNIGNMESIPAICKFMYDNEPPKTSILINNGDKYTNSSKVTLLIDSKDTGSGISQMSFKFGVSGSSWSGWEDYKSIKDFDLPGIDGEKTIYCKIKDMTGNIAEHVVDSIILDSTPPNELKITINNNSLYTNSAKVYLDLFASDKLSGVSEMSFKFDDGSWTDWEMFKTIKSEILPPGDGEKVIYLRVRDKAGNYAQTSDKIILDTEPPHSLKIQINDGNYKTNSTYVTLKLDAKDKISGVYQIALKMEPGLWGNWTEFINIVNFELSPDNGEKVIHFIAIDRVGNVAESVSAKIKLETNELVIDSDGDMIPDDIDAFPNDPTQWFDSDGDNYGDNLGGNNPDFYPNDPTRWEKDDDVPPEEKESKMKGDDYSWLTMLIIIFVIIIFITLVLIIIRNKKKKNDNGKNKNGETQLESIGSSVPEENNRDVPSMVTSTLESNKKYCKSCGQGMTYYPQNNRNYCTYCKKYN
jgi:hypothetical protein